MTRKIEIRIGNQTSFAAPNVMEPFEYAVVNGFDAFEWFPDKRESGAGWAEEDISKEQRAFIRETAIAHDIRLSVHVPWQANPLRSESQDIFLKDIEFAQDIGAVLINIHLYTEKGITSYVQAITPLIRELAVTGIRLSIENTPITGPGDFNELFRQILDLESVDVAYVGMCLDLGHANLYTETRNDYLRFVDLLSPHVPVIHLHLHENYGDQDSHLPLFTGPAGRDDSGIKGFIERMKRRRFSGCIIFEQWPQPPSLLRDARNRLIEMIGISMEPATKPPTASGDNFAEQIAEADQRNRSWREKLSWIDNLLSEDTFVPDIDRLIYLAIYIRFIGTGEVICTEDGRHFRPSHHAEIAQHIQDRLSRITTSENAFIIRKIYPWLPAFSSNFTRKEPLTRIRDIAHRNDIPKELKKEIKETLQNKLHRCAGPEDLVTSATLLKRITAPDASYPSDFVEEFKKFHEELKEFFNARSLDEQLEAVLREGSAEPHTLELIHRFLAAKKEAHSIGQLTGTFELLTALRSQICKGIKRKTGPEAQRLQMADIRLEDFSFVLLSQIINLLDAQERDTWSCSLKCLGLAVGNLRLGGLDTRECQAIESELGTWRRDFRPEDHEQLIRLKATVDRCRRLTELYCNRILSLFPEKVKRLGSALGVKREKIRVFCEIDIRRHLVFQVSRLVALLSKEIRGLAALPPWDVIVPGRASGLLISAACLDDLAAPLEGPRVALLERVKGDEEIPAGVVGLIVANDTPLLSHLAVRARQGDIVFVVCEDTDRYRELRRSVGKQVILDVDVSAETVDLEFSSRPDTETGEIRQRRIWIPDVILSPDHRLLPLDQVTRASGGSKAAAARWLEELARAEGSGFVTAPGVVVPFGVMEEALRASGIEQDYWILANRLNRLPDGEFLETLKRLRAICMQLVVPDEIVSGVKKRFPGGRRLIVRSSSNCEDLEGLSGAGLYDSIVNVPPSGVAQAVKEVWASIWTRRAALSRKKFGILHKEAHMAVLIQQMVVPELSFVMHTLNPVSKDPDEVYVELAVGLGEALTSGGIPGVPYRMVCNKQTGEVYMLAFASFSHAIWPGPSRDLIQETVDYSRIELSKNRDFRKRLGSHLGSIARSLEDAAGRPQDIEGLFLRHRIYLVQSRPQQGVS